MNWYCTIKGGHTHVRVFMNGAKCGDLCFRNEEFQKLKDEMVGINFLADDGYNEEAQKLHSCQHPNVTRLPGVTSTGVKISVCQDCHEQIEEDLS